jgi:putative DNA primase/helicase
MPKHPTGSFEAGFSIWSKMFRQCSDSRATLNVIVNEAADFVARGCSKQLVVDEVTERAVIGHGMDADVVQRALAEALERPPRSNGKANGRHTPEAKASGQTIPKAARSEAGSELQFDRLSDIEPEAIAWIWPGRIARRKLTLLAGDPGMGKSQIGIDIGARITKAGNWPDSGVAPAGSVIVLSAEDSTADTVRPRFEVAGANLDRVQVLRAVIEKGKRRTFNLQKDLAALGNKVTEVGDVTFVIIDPITAYMGKVDGHQTTDVRSVLEPVADFADKSNVAVLGITHPPKNAPVKAINAFTGSLAYVAVARTVFIAIDEPETERRLLVPVKNNLGPLAPGLGYRLEQTILADNIVPSRIAWDSAPVTVTANEALAASAEGASNPSALTEAKEFLQEELANGPVPQAEIKKRAQDADISEKTLRRAKKALRVIAAKSKGNLTGNWMWEMPGK